MALSKSLLIKGLAGVAAIGGVATGGAFAFNKGWFGGGDSGVADLREEGELGKFSHRELIDGVGLSCQLTGKELKESEDKECRVKDNGTLNIKIDEKTEEGVTFTTSDSAKLRVRRSKGGETYSRGLKFVVDSGDITLTKKEGGSTATTIPKLEQFETYEIEKDGDKFYLKRKTKADVGIKNALGLGRLTLPEEGKSDASDSFSNAGEIKQIRFEGHDEGISISSGSITLKVSKTVDTTTFPFGYRFNFTFPSEITIKGQQLKGNIPYEFKIKRGTGNSLTLEQAWTDDNTFTKKAGLDCSSGSNNECSVSSTDSQKLNVKVGHLKKEGISSVSSGKIKMETGQAGYNQGLKFSIADGDVTLGEGGTGDITKLEELETYEIAEDGGKYYLTKKTSPDQLIKTSLVLPSDCKLPTTDASVSCELDDGKFKAINFEGKETDKPTGTATLTISKANSTDFPFGYKFTFETKADTEIKASNTTIKAKIPKDFKIKKGSGTGTGITLSLEKAWDDASYSLAAKVGLECTGSSGNECCTKSTSGSVKLNVKKGTDVKTDIDSVSTSSSAKIKVEKDKEGYNQGLKFTITGGDVSLTGGTKAADSTNDIDKLEELETYEITEDKGKYYLTRKTSKEDVLKTSLSIPEGCFTSPGTSCTLTNDQLKGIKFENKEESFNPSGTSTLTVTKTSSTDFPLGYRFTLQTEQDITIKSSDNVVKKNIPTDFKIKKNQSAPTTLSLEKAWTDNDYSFAKKAGLECTTSSGDTCCSQTSGVKINVKKGTDTKTDIDTVTTSGTAKIKVEKDKEGYNQGLKFTITGGDVSLTGGNKVDGSTNDITKLEEYETYEITEEGGKYYLTRKNEAIKTIGDLLGLTEAGCSLSSNSCSLSNEQIKKIKFDGKDTNGVTTSGTATLTIAKADKKEDFPLGYKFTFNTTADVTIKTGTTSIKANIPTEFKIKKGTESQNPALTLEKAWTAESLGKKVGLTCSNSNNNECTKASDGNQLNIMKDSDKKESITGTNSSSKGKIKVEKDQVGYNYGLKFYIDGGDVTLTGGTDSKRSGSNEDLSVLEEYETYEITEEGGKWYLTRKDESIVFIKKQLGLDFCNDDTWSRYGAASGASTSNITFTCEINSAENLKKIKFHNNSNSNISYSGKINLNLEMKRQKTNNNSNYDELKVTISDNRDTDTNKTSICIPDGNGGKIDIKGGSGGNASGASYKIKKGTGADTSWCLEKKDGGRSSGGSCSS